MPAAVSLAKSLIVAGRAQTLGCEFKFREVFKEKFVEWRNFAAK
jgi:hypothetical protein